MTTVSTSYGTLRGTVEEGLHAFLGVPYGRGSRLGGDRDSDAVLDGDEPVPALTVSRVGPDEHLQWPAQPAGWVLESAPDLDPHIRGVRAREVAARAGSVLHG